MIAAKTKAQLGIFLGKVFPHFSKPKTKFLYDMLYGIQASGDTQLSSVMRSITDVSDMRHAVEKRLSRNLAAEGLADDVGSAVLEAGAKSVREDSLILVDPTEICKEYGFHMEYVSMVRDASRSSKEGRDVLVHGYHGCMAVACRPGARKTVPLALKLWSSRAPGHKSENDEVIGIVDAIMGATNGRGTIVYDRGGDRPAFYEHFIDDNRRFVIRMSGRTLLSWGSLHDTEWLASQCQMSFRHHVEFDSHGKDCRVPISFGALPVRLPTRPEKTLHMVVVRGFGQKPMMLLTSLPVPHTFEGVWRIVESYLTRWRIEETIRFVKQSYRFENLRVLSYRAIRNMASVVLAATYFATAWIGRHVKHEVLAEHLERLSRRLSEIPEFANYAIADGIKRAFSRFGRFARRIVTTETIPAPDTSPGFLPGFEELFSDDLC